jgi:hypothetical protein
VGRVLDPITPMKPPRNDGAGQDNSGVERAVIQSDEEEEARPKQKKRRVPRVLATLSFFAVLRSAGLAGILTVYFPASSWNCCPTTMLPSICGAQISVMVEALFKLLCAIISWAGTTFHAMH